MEQINFSYNWNNKLYSKCFITYRVLNSRFRIEADYDIFLKDKHIGTAKLVHYQEIPLNKVTPGIAYIDTGYDLKEFHSIVAKMYKLEPGKPPPRFVLLFLRWNEYPFNISKELT